jgi:hypothetical protein
MRITSFSNVVKNPLKKRKVLKYNLRGVPSIFVKQKKMNGMFMTNWQHGFFCWIFVILFALTDRCVTFYLAYKLNSTGCATIFVPAQRTLMLLLLSLGFFLLPSYSKCCRKIDRHRKRNRKRKKMNGRICWSRIYCMCEMIDILIC